MKVRFAPSPTGYLHVGGLRTALFNYLLAKQRGGTFLLRIEDTDQNRKVEGAVQNLIDSLNWAGLDYDEGPGKNQGHEPYFQSQRLNIYQRHIEQLLEAGHAYYCFCSTERLETLRRRQIAAKQQPGYDGHCRSIPAATALERAKTEPHVVRMKIPGNGHLDFDDQIHGHISYPLNQIDDQVLLKTDGFPTYHLANVVDDHYMGVTLVIRGEEWLPSTPKHILLYQYLGWEHPQFAHLPLLLNANHAKLSKRQGDVAVEDYRARGILPEALVNFIALLGWNPGDDRELFSLAELVRAFSLERVNKAGAVFNLDKLYWMNGRYLRSIDVTEYLNRARVWLADHSHPAVSDETLLLVRDSLTTLADLPEKLAPLVAEAVDVENDEAAAMLESKSGGLVLDAAVKILDTREELLADDFKVMMKQIQQKTGIKGKNLWMPIRIALTGRKHGPELPRIVEIFGKDKVRERLAAARKL